MAIMEFCQRWATSTRLLIRTMRFDASITVHRVQENLLGQKFIVDATLFVDLIKAGKSDNVHDTVSYADVYRYACVVRVPLKPTLPLLLSSAVCRHIKTVMEGRPHKLLESVADRLANEIMNDYHQVQGLQLHLKKPHVAVTGVVESLGKPNTTSRIASLCSHPHDTLAEINLSRLCNMHCRH